MTSWAPTPPVQTHEHGSENEARLLRCEPAGMGKKTCCERRPRGHYGSEHRAAANDRFPPPRVSPDFEPRRPAHWRSMRSQLGLRALGFAFYRAARLARAAYESQTELHATTAAGADVRVAKP
jgi:hypothetical protein